MKNNSFLETMQAHSDQKLKEIVERKRDDFQPEAIQAAEHVLRERKVKFKEAEPDEIVEMTFEEIREDIMARQKKGQSMDSIRAYYKDCGVNIYSKNILGEDAAPSNGWSYMKVRGIFFLVGIAGAIFVNLAKSGDKTLLNIIVGAIVLIGALWFLLTFRKGKK
jgi:hypothetical protein